MSELMFPKKGKTKKRKRKHPESILQEKNGHCFLCMLEDDYRIHKDIHEHHVFNGPDRDACEEEGLTVYLCVKHHIDGPAAVHNNRENDLILKQHAQRVWEETHTREEFQSKFRKSYL